MKKMNKKKKMKKMKKMKKVKNNNKKCLGSFSFDFKK